MKKTLLFTFDYELFLGSRSGRVYDCIIEPTGRSLDLLSRYEFKAVFFVDTVYLMRLEEIVGQYEEAAKDLAAIKKQLATIVQQGHYIFPHIHAHWLDAVYLPGENEWSLENTRYYQFSRLLPEQQRLLFDRSVAIIRSIACPIIQDYKVDAYRAGGWSIQPFNGFRSCFLQHGILHEWSVIPGKYHFSDAHTFDFRKAPSDKSVYRFNEDPCQEDSAGPFTEWTISTLSLSRFEKWIDFKVNGIIRRLGRRGALKGSTVSSVIREEGDIYSGKNAVRTIASFEGLNPYLLKKYLAAIRRSGYFHFISHPKLITDLEFDMIRSLFASLQRINGIETDFRKLQIK